MIVAYKRFAGPDGSLVMRPTIRIKIKNKTKSLSTWSLIDSGADRTLLNLAVGTQLGFDFKGKKPDSYTQGISGAPEPIWFSDVELEVEGFPGLTVITKAGFVKSNNVGILLGHIGFFEFFDIKFQTAKAQFEIDVAEKP